VRVGDKVIKNREFLQRSEYAIRPLYCRDNSYIHKKIVLNSLIAEKLLAMEAGEDNQLVNNPDFLAYLQGRKEQAMRQVQYYQEFYKNVEPQTGEIRKEMEYANRRYNISYFTVHDEEIAKEIENRFSAEKIDLNKMYQTLTGDSIAPQREVTWTERENQTVIRSLFTEEVTKGKIIGPVNISDKKFLFMEVDGWIDREIVSPVDYEEQYQLAFEKIKAKQALKLYKDYVGVLMRGKEINFYADTFRDLLQIIGPMYIKSEKIKKKMFNNSYWQNNEKEEYISDLPGDVETLDHKPFFSIDGRIWTVDRFRSYMKRHPLQFRKEKLKTNNFAEHFKLAVVDMVRDYYITQDAYEKRYHKSQIVIDEVNIWRDHLLSLFQKYKYLESQNVEEKGQLQIVEKYMNPYIEGLQKKYSNDIEINTHTFEELQLTRIDMIALQPDQPFPVVVPSFPLVTSGHRMDYGKAMQ
jgi:hypothetical protein